MAPYLVSTSLATDYVVGLLVAIRRQEARNHEKNPELREHLERRHDVARH